MSGCGGNKAPKQNCVMYKQYVKCTECPEFPDGYPDGITLQVSCGGKCYFIVSNQDDNNYDPCDYIGNTDPSKPWLVMSAMDYWQYLIDQSTMDFLTEDEVQAIINGIFGDIISDGKLDCAKLIAHCKLATTDQLSAVTPSIGPNGNWFIGGVDTGVPATGPTGPAGQDGTNGTDGESAGKLQSCAGAELVDGDKIVKCDEFTDLFKDRIKDGCYSLNSANEGCETPQQLVWVPKADGCGHIAILSEDDNCLEADYPGEPEIWPSDITDTSQWYTLGNAPDSSTLDENSNGFVACLEGVMECDTKFEVFPRGTDIIYNPDQHGESLFIPVLNGTYLGGSTTSAIGSSPFTQQEGNQNLDFKITIPAGPFKLCLFMFAVSSAADEPPVQVRLASDRFELCRRVQ